MTSTLMTDRQTQLQSKASHGKREKKTTASCAIRLWRTEALRPRNGTLQCSAGPDWHGYHGIIDTEASTWAPAVGRPSKSAGCLAAHKETTKEKIQLTERSRD